MFNTTVLDVVIGMVFVYLLLSLMCSAANEMVELWLKNRATDLEKGLRGLLNDPNGNGLVKKMYDHALVSGLFEGKYDPKALGKLQRALGRVKLPSYIPARTFALVLLDTAFPSKADSAGGTATSTPSPLTTTEESRNAFEALRRNISNLGNEKVEQALRSLVDSADNDVAKARENIEKWFDASMDRVSGWYKRRAQVFVFIIGLFVTIGVNADSVLIAKRLSADKALRESVVSAAESYAKVHADQTAAQKPATTPGGAPTEGAAKPTASPAASPSAAAGSASPSAKPPGSASPAPSVSPVASPATAPDSPVGSADNGVEDSKADCDKNPETPQCQYQASLEKLKSLALPIGWDSAVDGQQWPGLHVWEVSFWTNWYRQFRIHIFGWLLTALAISLGAPFWFDLLNKFILIRATVKPREKSPEEKPKN